MDLRLLRSFYVYGYFKRFLSLLLPHQHGHDHLVGRFFMEHPHFTVAFGLLNHEHPGVTRFSHAKRSDLRVGIYEPVEAFQKKEKILNFGLRFVPKQGMGLPSPKLSFKNRLKRFVCESETLLDIVGDINQDFGVNCPFDMWFKTASEQSPDPASRIRLGQDIDRFGNRRVDVNWQLNALDKYTLKQSALQAGRIMAINDLGRVRLPEWLLDSGLVFPGLSKDEVAGYHHMGTTRMADSPEGALSTRAIEYSASTTCTWEAAAFSLQADTRTPRSRLCN